MFAKAALLPIALAAGQISIPLGKAPRIIEQPKNPIERYGPLWAEVCEGAGVGWSVFRAISDRPTRDSRHGEYSP